MASKLILLVFFTFLFYHDETKCKGFLSFNYLVSKTDIIKQVVPLGGNSWLTVKAVDGKEEITNEGWKNWESSDAIFSAYIKLTKPGTLELYALLSVPEGESIIECSINNVSKLITLNGSDNKEQFLGNWNISDSGYIKIDMKGIKKSGNVFAIVSELYIAGSSVDENTVYVKDNKDNYFYWGRRGPSVHINYDTSETGNNAEWFYNEITVPAGNDVIGSYFMADGFKEGYFGMQVNSKTERHILFSVWSPFQTDDPSAIPEDKKIILLKKGADVHAGEFGNEGSGGQSYLNYNWKADNTYKFLLHAQPAENDHTIFTAYFFTPESGKWNLIASFSRPSTHTYLTHLHSFLENFEPATGYITRKAYYSNQWVVNKNGEWKALSKMMFTGDATAQKKYRLDYSGGEENNSFFLRNCGFFNNNTPLRSTFAHKPSETHPPIDLRSFE